VKRRVIGHSSVTVTELGFGAASIGNLYTAISDEDALATVGAA
jgi:D-threo-aldose 1-dehydrogenase